jgi:hypothetical protein
VYPGTRLPWIAVAAAASTFIGALVCHAAPSAVLAQSPPAGQSQPVVRDLVIDGATVFGRTEILRWIGVAIGEPLPAPPDELARELQSHYEREGFSRATVRAAFDETAGRLEVHVNEGRIDDIELVGVDRDLAARLADQFDIRPGDIFNRREVERAVHRMLAPARGAVETTSGPVAGEVVHGTSKDDRRVRAVDLVEREGRRVLVVRLLERHGSFGLNMGTESREDWFSPVDGFSPAIGFESVTYDHRHFNHAFVTGFVSYKFGAEDAGYAIGFERPLFAGPKLYFGGEIYELTASDDRWRLSTLEQSLVALAFKNSFRDYYRRRGYQLHAALRPHPSHEVLFAWRDERHESLENTTDYSFFRDDHRFRANAAASPGELRSILLGYIWDSRGLEREQLAETYRRHQMDSAFGTNADERPGWLIEWTSEFAAPGALGGDFDFRRHVLNARRYTRLSPRQRLHARVIAGLSDGTLPPQRQFALGGIGSVHGYGFKEEVGQRMALLNLEYHLTPWGGAESLRLIGFLDWGRIYRPLGGSRGDALTGLGVGFSVGSVARVDLGWRADDIPDSLQVLFRLRHTF